MFFKIRPIAPKHSVDLKDFFKTQTNLGIVSQESMQKILFQERVRTAAKDLKQTPIEKHFEMYQLMFKKGAPRK